MVVVPALKTATTGTVTGAGGRGLADLDRVPALAVEVSDSDTWVALLRRLAGL